MGGVCMLNHTHIHDRQKKMAARDDGEIVDDEPIDILGPDHVCQFVAWNMRSHTPYSQQCSACRPS